MQKKKTPLAISYASAPCILGWVIVATTSQGVCAVMFGDTPEELPALVQGQFPGATLTEGGPEFQPIIRAVIQQINHPDEKCTLPLDLRGTVFQQQVWKELCQIKVRETVSYTDVARRIGRPKAVRAVGTACGANRIAVLIPCHRVLGKNGKLTGYRWGMERKRQLLDAEQYVQQ
ncbi:MAG: hypothetical protein CSA34_05790 [Desulfobulbus propionicus]|nr:MAG: hypothetical protein CSA34_05790 [Desulfobulbus propionicus]